MIFRLNDFFYSGKSYIFFQRFGGVSPLLFFLRVCVCVCVFDGRDNGMGDGETRSQRCDDNVWNRRENKGCVAEGALTGRRLLIVRREKNTRKKGLGSRK